MDYLEKRKDSLIQAIEEINFKIYYHGKALDEIAASGYTPGENTVGILALRVERYEGIQNELRDLLSQKLELEERILRLELTF
jgi:hypothetical protein